MRMLARKSGGRFDGPNGAAICAATAAVAASALRGKAVCLPSPLDYERVTLLATARPGNGWSDPITQTTPAAGVLRPTGRSESLTLVVQVGKSASIVSQRADPVIRGRNGRGFLAPCAGFGPPILSDTFLSVSSMC